MRKALERVIASVDLNRTGAPVLDRHLYIWLLDAGCDGANEMLAASDALIGQAHKLIGLLSTVEQNLPVDKGRRRPMDEDRFIIYLAEEFDASGGEATAYRSEHTVFGYAETAFRKFVHEFYKMLRLESHRKGCGLDEAIIRALEYRRRHSEKG
jgi:hypothetical protein